MLPPLKLVKHGLRRTTETLAAELALAQPGTDMPDWTDLEWRLASAAAVAHGVSPCSAASPPGNGLRGGVSSSTSASTSSSATSGSPPCCAVSMQARAMRDCRWSR